MCVYIYIYIYIVLVAGKGAIVGCVAGLGR